MTGGEEGFRRQLVHWLSRTPSLGSAALELDAAPGPMPARMDPLRFFDALTRVIEEQVARGAGRFRLHAARSGPDTVLTVRTDGAAWGLDAERAAVREQVFARSGARGDYPPAGSDQPLVLVFEAE